VLKSLKNNEQKCHWFSYLIDFKQVTTVFQKEQLGLLPGSAGYKYKVLGVISGYCILLLNKIS